MKIVYLLKIILFMASGTLLMSACASPGDDSLVGARWVALQDITFPPRSTTVFIQDGKVLERSNQRDRFAPNCGVESTKGRNERLTIKKGSIFNILSVTYPTTAFDEVITIYETRMRVESINHRNIRTIQCNERGNMAASHLSIETMQATMKGVFELENRIR